MNDDVRIILENAKDEIQNVYFDLITLNNPEGDSDEDIKSVGNILKKIEKMLKK